MADFSVPWQPLDLRPGAEFLLGAINQKRQRDIAERQAATQEEYAKLGFARLSAAAERERKKYDQDQQERLIRATADAEALEDAGNVNAADRLRRLHGIKVEPVLKSNLVSPSTVITPMEALGGPSRRQQLERPQPENPYRSPSTSDTRGAITPVQALEPDPEGTGAEETMPLTIPGDVEQHISSQTKLIGPRGEDLGINDPEARKAARLAKAERLRTVLGTVSPELGAIASLEAEGDLSAKDYAPTVKAYTSQQAEGGRNTRAQNAIDARQGKQDDQQAFLEAENAKYRTTPEEREKLARIAAQGRMGAAAITAGSGDKVERTNAAIVGKVLDVDTKIRQTGQWNKLAQFDKTAREIMANLGPNAANLNTRDAQVQLAKYFRGSIPTEGEMAHLYNNLGGYRDALNRLIARGEGALTPEEMRQIKKAANVVHREHMENVSRFMDMAKTRVKILADVPDQAQDLIQGYADELGLGKQPRLFDTEGGVRLGSGQRPSTRPRGEGKSDLDRLEDFADSLGKKK